MPPIGGGTINEKGGEMINGRLNEHDTAKIFLLNLQEILEAEIAHAVYRQCYKMVSPMRQQRADRYYRYEDALRCVMSEVLVRYVYQYIRNLEELPQIVYPHRGKPYLSNDEAFHFSVSHTGMFVAVGYAEGEIGIDIEEVNRSLDRKSIAASVFTPKEQAYVFQESEKETSHLRFTKIWTAKESYLKYLGCGFQKSPLSFSVDLSTRTISERKSGLVQGIAVCGKQLPEDYYLTACGNIEEISIEFIRHHSVMDVILQ